MFTAAVAARRLCSVRLAAVSHSHPGFVQAPLSSCTWRVLVGWCVPEEQYRKWKAELGADANPTKLIASQRNWEAMASLLSGLASISARCCATVGSEDCLEVDRL